MINGNYWPGGWQQPPPYYPPPPEDPLKAMRRAIKFVEERDELLKKKAEGGKKKDDEPKSVQFNVGQLMALLVFTGMPLGLGTVYFAAVIFKKTYDLLSPIFLHQ